MIAAKPPENRPQLGPLQALGRVGRVFYAPLRVARQVREQPNWAFPLLLTLFFSFLLAAVLMGRPEWQQTLQKALESSGQKLSDLEKVKLLEAMRVVSWIPLLVAPVVGNLVIAVLLWGVAVMLEGKVAFIPVFSYQLHAQMVTLIPRTLGNAWLLSRPGTDLSGGDLPLPFTLGYFLPAGLGSPGLRAVASAVDFFGLWYWAIVVAGLAVVAGLPWRRLLLPAAFLWILGVLVSAAASVLFTTP